MKLASVAMASRLQKVGHYLHTVHATQFGEMRILIELILHLFVVRVVEHGYDLLWMIITNSILSAEGSGANYKYYFQ